MDGRGVPLSLVVTGANEHDVTQLDQVLQAVMVKRKTPIERMNIFVAAERRPEAPRRVRHLDIEFRIDGAGIEREHAERAIQLSFERYCSVASSLAPDIVAEVRLTLNGESFPAVRQQIWTPRAT